MILLERLACKRESTRGSVILLGYSPHAAPALQPQRPVPWSYKSAVISFRRVYFLISLNSPRVHPQMGGRGHRTCGEPDEIESTAIGVGLNGSGGVLCLRALHGLEGVGDRLGRRARLQVLGDLGRVAAGRFAVRVAFTPSVLWHPYFTRCCWVAHEQWRVKASTATIRFSSVRCCRRMRFLQVL